MSDDETTADLKRLASETAMPRGAAVEVWGQQNDGRPIVVRVERDVTGEEQVMLRIDVMPPVYLDTEAASDLSEFLAILAAADGS
jgi:hypothetical protein